MTRTQGRALKRIGSVLYHQALIWMWIAFVVIVVNGAFALIGVSE